MPVVISLEDDVIDMQKHSEQGLVRAAQGSPIAGQQQGQEGGQFLAQGCSRGGAGVCRGVGLLQVQQGIQKLSYLSLDC